MSTSEVCHQQMEAPPKGRESGKGVVSSGDCGGLGSQIQRQHGLDISLLLTAVTDGRICSRWQPTREIEEEEEGERKAACGGAYGGFGTSIDQGLADWDYCKCTGSRTTDKDIILQGLM